MQDTTGDQTTTLGKQEHHVEIGIDVPLGGWVLSGGECTMTAVTLRFVVHGGARFEVDVPIDIDEHGVIFSDVPTVRSVS